MNGYNNVNNGFIYSVEFIWYQITIRLFKSIKNRNSVSEMFYLLVIKLDIKRLMEIIDEFGKISSVAVQLCLPRSWKVRSPLHWRVIVTSRSAGRIIPCPRWFRSACFLCYLSLVRFCWLGYRAVHRINIKSIWPWIWHLGCQDYPNCLSCTVRDASGGFSTFRHREIYSKLMNY